MTEALRKLVRWAMRDARYHKLYPSSVQRTNEDGTIDVLPDDPEMRGTGLGARPMPGLPGVEIEAAQGARCLLGFQAGDPRRPYIYEWESGGLGAIRFDGGTRGFARVGDSIKLAMPPTINVTGVVQGTQTIPGTPPTIVPIPPTPLVNGLVVVSPEPSAIVQSGNPKLLA